MKKSEELQTVTAKRILCYARHLKEQEKSQATIQKYTHDLTVLSAWLPEGKATKTAMIGWKEHLAKTYAPTSVNTMLAAANGFFEFYGAPGLKMKPLKIQREIFCPEEKELTRAEYTRLVRAAAQSGNERLSLLIQTICATGIRVSELQSITVEAVKSGHAEVSCKGKRRTVFLPDHLCRILRCYTTKQKRTAGAVFITKSGKPLDRSNIWRDMKALCESAGVTSLKVFPHNLRHLFARTYYSLEKDISRLADILGHENVNTTRIYTKESGAVHARQMERLGLIIT